MINTVIVILSIVSLIELILCLKLRNDLNKRNKAHVIEFAEMVKRKNRFK
jgi:hypothetical protein